MLVFENVAEGCSRPASRRVIALIFESAMRVIRKGIETAVAKNKLGEVAAAIRDGIHVEPAVAIVKPAEAMLPLSGRADGEVETAEQIVFPGALVDIGQKQ